MPFLLNLAVALLAAFGLSVLFGAGVVWLENLETRNVSRAAIESPIDGHAAAPRALIPRARVSALTASRGDTDKDRNVA